MALHGHRAAPSITGPLYFSPRNLLTHDTDIDDDGATSVASVEYDNKDHLPRRVHFAPRKNKCSYHRTDEVKKTHPWPEHLDQHLHANGGVTDAYPWPDFLGFDYVSKRSKKTYFKWLWPPLKWKGEHEYFWGTGAEYHDRKQFHTVRPSSRHYEPGTTVTRDGDPKED